jgi:hypothetical protein
LSKEVKNAPHRSNGECCTPNGNGSARIRVERGISLAHQTRLSKSQRAVIAADILDGARLYQPTRVDLVGLLNVSVSMIDQAQRLSPAARTRIANGKATLATFKEHPAPTQVLHLFAEMEPALEAAE